LFDKAIGLCRRAGFKDILLRGDTDFSQTTELDRWDVDGVRFVFGYDASATMVGYAEDEQALLQDGYRELKRRADELFANKKRRAPQPRVKEQLVRDNGYKNLRLKSEDVAELVYQPLRCKREYRFIVVRKNLSVERGEHVLFDDVRYLFYVTNDNEMAAEKVVRNAAQRCNQENLIAQLKGGVRALHAPVNTLNANWAYMVMASLAWTLKAWMALSLPISPRWRDKHRAERNAWLKMELSHLRQRYHQRPRPGRAYWQAPRAQAARLATPAPRLPAPRRRHVAHHPPRGDGWARISPGWRLGPLPHTPRRHRSH